MSDQAAPAPVGLPERAKLFMAATAVAAGVVAAAALTHRVGEARGWTTFLIVVAAASATQLFAFHTIRNQVFHTTPLFFVAGAVLLEPQFAVLLPLISHIGDWIKQRYAWYIQTFNIVNFTLAVMSAWWVARLVSNHWLEGTPKSWAIGGAAAAAVYVVINNAGFATILFLARGHSPRSILTPQVIAADAALAALGIAFASFWRSDPWLIPFAIAPVFLLHQALHLPQLQEEARVDPKTELFNARHFDEALREEHARATRFGRPLSLILADLDLLRNINNTYGHLAGDAVLSGVADIIRTHVRDYDIAARLGGEEFAIMLPETPREEALELAERIRDAVARTPFWADSVGEHVAATLSVGVASFPKDETDAIRLVNAADLAAYRAKLQGRNRVAGVSTEPLLRPVGRIGAAAALGQQHQPLPRRQAVRPADEAVAYRPAALRPPVALVTAIGIAAGAFGAVFGTSGDVVALLAFAAFVAVTQLIALRLDHGSVSVSAIGVLAGAAVVGPRAALPLAVVAAAVDWAVRRLPLAEIFLDVAALSLGALAAAGIFAAAPPSAAGGAATIASGAAAGAAYFAVLALVYGLAAAAAGREPWWRAWRGRFAWILPHYGVSGLVAGVIAIAYRRADLYALAAFSVPLLALRETQSAFLGHAETSAENLRDATEKIQTQSDSLERVNRLLRERSAAMIDGLSAIVAARDARAARHSRRVCELALLVGRELGLSDADLEALGYAALFHDIGKLTVPEAILLKPGSPSAEEWAVIRCHSDEGARMIEQVGFLAHTGPAIRHHHERFDGEGYPEGLRGESIPLDARIIHVAEAFDSMCTNQTYRPARTLGAALAEVQRLAGTQFCPRCVSALERVFAAAAEERTSTSNPAS